MAQTSGTDRRATALAALRSVEGRLGIAAPMSRTPPVVTPPPTDELFSALLPGGVLPAGAITVITGSSRVLVLALAATTAPGGWLAIAGAPELGILALSQAGVDLRRTVLVPEPGELSARVVGALIDGFAAVVVGPKVFLTDSARRQLATRARDRETALVSTVAWPGAALVLRAEQSGWTGVDDGRGRLRDQELTVHRTGRHGAAQPATFTVNLDDNQAPVVRRQQAEAVRGLRAV